MADSLRIPVNPAYDFARAPEDQAAYVNPVRLNDYVIRLANTALRLGVRIDALSRDLAAAKAALQTAEHALEDFQQDLLVRYPPNSLATKSNRLLDRFIRQQVEQENLGDEWRARLTALRAARRQVDQLELELDGARALAQTIKVAGEQIQTHLSFVKAEARARL